MRTITNELINEIRNKTDIVNVISNYLPLTKRGKNYFGVCPFHDDHSPSMSVSSEKQIYTCFSCGASGNVFTFVSEYEHISFIEAVKLLGEKLGLSLSNVKEEHIDPKYASYYKIYDLASKFYQNNINTALGKEAYAYLEKRHFDKDTIKKFGIGLSSKNTPLTTLLLKSGYDKETLITLGLTNDGENDLFINRIMFPLFDLNGQVVGFSGRIYLTKDSSKYVNSKESPIFKKGELLYNYHNVKEHLKKNDTLIIMEGFMDVIRASTIGIDNCVASMGTAVTKNQALLLKKSANNIVLCFDGDSAGEDATISCAELLLKNGVTPKVVRLEEELDPDEYILKYGEEAFKQKINNPISLLEFKMNLLKKDHKFNDLKDISNYVNEVIKNLLNENDEIVIDLTLKKVSGEFNIDYEILKNKYLASKNNTKKEVIILKENKQITKDKYLLAYQSIINYMLKSTEAITIYEKKAPYLPNDLLRYLANEIISYYHKYGTINVADFISYIEDNNELKQALKDVLKVNTNDNFEEDEINDYLKIINEANVKSKIKRLEEDLKKETDPIKQGHILDEINQIKLILGS